MLERPRVGMKKQTMAMIRRIVPNRLQKRRKTVEVAGQNTLSVRIDFKLRVMQVFMLQRTESPSRATGGIPRKGDCSNRVSKPPVVGVLVVATSSKMICPEA